MEVTGQQWKTVGYVAFLFSGIPALALAAFVLMESWPAILRWLRMETAQ